MNSTEKNKRYYLVDYENVHQAGMNGIENLTENDVLVIFYTINAETLTFSIYEKLVQCKAEIQLYKVQCGGKNALDFQLSSYVGYIIGKNPTAEYYIISNDRGYEYIINFWKEKNIIIKMSSDISGNVQKMLPAIVMAVKPVSDVKTVFPVSAVKTAETAETAFDKAVKPLNLTQQDKSKLCSIFYSIANIADVNNRLSRLNQVITKHFGAENAVRYYSVLKPLIEASSVTDASNTSETAFDNAVKPLNLSKDSKQKLFDIYSKASSVKNVSKRKQQISNNIMKTFGNSKTKKYYSAIKPLIK